MTEKRLLNFIFTEGCLLTLFGFFILVLPKITELSFGFVLYSFFIIYGGYRVISSVFSRNFLEYFIIDLLPGVVILFAGFAMLFAEYINVMIIISSIGLYFISSSISAFACAIRTENILKSRGLIFSVSAIKLFFALTVVVMISASAMWLAGILAGIDFILSGISMIDVCIASKNNII